MENDGDDERDSNEVVRLDYIVISIVAALELDHDEVEDVAGQDGTQQFLSFENYIACRIVRKVALCKRCILPSST